MQVLTDSDPGLPLKQRSTVTIGSYDGLHRGHIAVIEAAVHNAKTTGTKSVVVTFDPHPLEILSPQNCPKKLFTKRQRRKILNDLGVDYLRVINFDVNWAAMSAKDFAQRVLVDELRAATVHVGTDFAFGAKATGTLDVLKELGELHGFDVEALTLVAADSAKDTPETDDTPTDLAKISSTAIREAVISGDVVTAQQMLGRAYQLEGVVIDGDKRGRLIGFPTANIALDTSMALPKTGVYAAHVHLPAQTPAHNAQATTANNSGAGTAHNVYIAAVNIGVRPTFEKTSTQPVLEVHILDFDADLYGELIQVDLIRKIRDEQIFASVDELKVQIAADIKEIRSLNKSSQTSH